MTDLRNIAVISDLHVGCQLALCSPRGARVDNGGRYHPNVAQRRVWDIWKGYWKWIDKVRRNEPFGIIINGDLLDGVHHGASTQWSHNLSDQVAHAYEILAPIRERADKLWIIRGTPVHGGESGQQEEDLATRLGAERARDGKYSRNDLWLDVAGDLIQATHHIGTTSSAAHETSAVNAEMAALMTECGRFRQKPPTVIVRSHRHRPCEIRMPSVNNYITAFVTACWQLPTPFAFKVAGGRNTLPAIGGSIIRKGDEELHTRHYTEIIERGRPE
jgi:hypothetical protein